MNLERSKSPKCLFGDRFNERVQPVRYFLLYLYTTTNAHVLMLKSEPNYFSKSYEHCGVVCALEIN